MSAPVSEWFLTLEPLTAFFFSCLVPTLFLRRLAAIAPPPSATKSAIVAITFAYVSLSRSRSAIVVLPEIDPGLPTAG